MKVTGFLVALAAAAPMASAIPFKMADFLAPLARAPAPVEAPQEFPQIRTTNLTARGTNVTARGITPNDTVADKRAFLPQGDDDKTKRSFENGVECK